jgi:hypothetical protein
MQQQDAFLGPVALGRRLEHVDQLHQRDVEAEYGIDAAMFLVVEEVVVDDFFLVLEVVPRPFGQDHVVDALEGGARHPRVMAHDLQVVLETPFPVLIAEPPEILELGDHLDDFVSRRPSRHSSHLLMSGSNAPEENDVSF